MSFICLVVCVLIITLFIGTLPGGFKRFRPLSFYLTNFFSRHFLCAVKRAIQHI